MAAKLLILHRTATAFEAACAMKDNHVGCVLVVDTHHHLAGIVTDRDLCLALTRADFDARATPLSAVMTDVVGTCEEGARHADVVCAMKQYACRRVPLLRHGRPVGLVTLDDLLVQGSVSAADARDIVASQLAQPARLKPAGSIRPAAEPPGPPSLDRRREARREQVFRDLCRDLEGRPGFGTRERAEAALHITLALVCRRLHPDDARGLAAALPAGLREACAADAEAPPEPVTVEALGEALHDRLGLPPDAAVDLLLSLCDAVAETSPSGAGGRLRWYLRELFPRARS